MILNYNVEYNSIFIKDKIILIVWVFGQRGLKYYCWIFSFVLFCKL